MAFNWKFWEWEIWQEEETPPQPLPMTDEKNTLVINIATPDPEAFQKAQKQVEGGNPEAERIRQQLLAARKK